MAEKKKAPRENAFEKFPQPRTFPSQWEMSGMMAAEGPQQDADAEDRMETFPEPRTIPAKWDVSGLKK
jgi:hypothetical protein